MKLVKQANRNVQPPENYILFRNCQVFSDKYLDEVIIQLNKPITPQMKEEIAYRKAEEKRINKETRLAEHEKSTGERLLDLRKISYRKRKIWADEWDPDSYMNPWYYQSYYKDNFFELIERYKFPLQKVLSVDQILSLRKAIEVDEDKVKKKEKKPAPVKQDLPLRARS